MMSSEQNPSNSLPFHHDDETNENGGDDSASSSINNDIEGQSRCSRHSDNNHHEGENEKLVVAKREHNFVRCLRVVVLLILVAAAALSATAVYLYTSSDQNKEFESTFQQYARLVVDTVQVNAQHKLEAVGAIADLIQGYAMSVNATWPLVTVPYFEEHVIATKSLTDAYGVTLFPIVSNETKLAWEDYSAEHLSWINESYESQRDAYGTDYSGPPRLDNQSWFDYHWGGEKFGDRFVDPRNPDFSSGIGEPIFRTIEVADHSVSAIIVEPGPGPYFPQWQAASMCPYYHGTMNANYGQYTDFLESTHLSTATHTAVLGMPWTDFVVPGYVTTLLYPIFDSFHRKARNVVAFLGVDIFWEAYLSRILPKKASGIHVVIANTYGDVFTFELVGNKAIFMGDGDLHETAFDHMAVVTRFGQYLYAEPWNVSSSGKEEVNYSNDTATTSAYVGAPLYDQFYQYNFTIYPSAELKSQYVTGDPTIYMVVVLLVFLFSSLVFVVYDCIVERRQRLVMHSAVRSDALVSSLFPSKVKSQLYEHHSKLQEEKQRQPDRSNRNGEDRLTMDSLGISNLNNVKNEGPPIAELYPNATVLFADIAGFTAWSSKHTPADVFTLLETLYGSFDKRATRRGVFKIETIGDCYVAVTGLPIPRGDHAVAMARFSRDMMALWDEEKMRLLPVLGPELLELGLRVGMHSGPVTAGVLRGARARFQLFGDTVNTASRIESNGQPMKIHLSEETAKLIREANKEHWLVPRPDKIEAKGKGEMQTYWLVTTGSNTSKRTASSAGARSGTLRDDDSVTMNSPNLCTDDGADGDLNENGKTAVEASGAVI